MKATTIFTALATALPAIAAPTARAANTPFGGIAIHSGSAIHLSSVNANGNAFWIGKPTQSYCSTEVVTDCPAGTETDFVGGDNGLSLSVEVPGGQQVYVNTDGSLGFNVVHSANFPTGSIRDGFSLAENGAWLRWHGNGFLAVPIGDAWKVYAAASENAPTNGTGFVLMIEQATTEYGAWQY